MNKQNKTYCLNKAIKWQVLTLKLDFLNRFQKKVRVTRLSERLKQSHI